MTQNKYYERLTRTIKVSCLAHIFAKSSLHVIQILFESCTLTTLYCKQLTCYTWTIMWLRPTLFRDTAPLPVSHIGYRDYHLPTYINCTAITPARKKLSAMTAKTRAIPALHRDYFPAKAPGHLYQFFG